MRRRLVDVVTGTRVEIPLRRVRRKFRQPPGPVEPYDEQLIEVMRRVLRRDSNAIDAGANAGLFVEYIVRLAPRGHHIAIEPVPTLAAHLRQQFPCVDVRECALGEQPARTSFRWVHDNAAFSGFNRRPWDTYDERSVELIEVDVTTFDTIARDQRVDFVKVDVEGAELEAFRGGLEMIRRNRPYIGFESSADADAMYALLVEGCGLHLSLMKDWLDQRPPMSLAQYADALSAGEYFFLAHP